MYMSVCIDLHSVHWLYVNAQETLERGASHGNTVCSLFIPVDDWVTVDVWTAVLFWWKFKSMLWNFLILDA